MSTSDRPYHDWQYLWLIPKSVFPMIALFSASRRYLLSCTLPASRCFLAAALRANRFPWSAGQLRGHHRHQEADRPLRGSAARPDRRANVALLARPNSVAEAHAVGDLNLGCPVRDVPSHVRV